MIEVKRITGGDPLEFEVIVREWAEVVTRVSDTHGPDKIEARATFTEKQLPTNPAPARSLSKSKLPGLAHGMVGIRAGTSALPQPLPLTLGSDLSGDIQVVGPDVSDPRVGDQVYGVTNPRFIGASAEYALVRQQLSRASQPPCARPDLLPRLAQPLRTSQIEGLGNLKLSRANREKDRG